MERGEEGGDGRRESVLHAGVFFSAGLHRGRVRGRREMMGGGGGGRERRGTLTPAAPHAVKGGGGGGNPFGNQGGHFHFQFRL